MKPGRRQTLKVKRETDIAYLLTDGDEEAFLHKKEALRDYEPDEKIDVFIYTDHQNRLTASTKVNMISVGSAAFLEVNQVKPDLGVFLFYGMVKDLLLFKKELPDLRKLWPKPGDKMFVRMKAEEHRLYAAIPKRKDIQSYFPKTTDKLSDGDEAQAWVVYIEEKGLVSYTTEGHEIFIHNDNTRNPHHLGESLNVKITYRVDDKKYHGTLIEQKEIQMDKDAQRIYDYLKAQGGSMPFTDKSDKDEIRKAFSMSKSAFKRGLGALYKTHRVRLEKDKTILQKYD